MPLVSVGSADDIFSGFDYSRDRLIDFMNRDFEGLTAVLWKTGDSPFIKDIGCQCKLGAYHKLSIEQRLGLKDIPASIYIGDYYKCLPCSSLSILMEMESGCEEFVVEFGERLGQTYKIVKFKRGLRYLKSFDYPKSILTKLLNDRNYTKCEPGASKLISAQFYGADGFTNKMMVNMYTESILMQNGLQHMIPYIATAFICADDSYYLVRDDKKLRLDDLDKSGGVFSFETTFSILAQVISFFHVMEPYQISFPFPTSDDISFSKSIFPKEFGHRDCRIASNISVCINISEDCGITAIGKSDNTTRVFHHTESDARSIRCTPFTPKVESLTFDFTNCVTRGGCCVINKAYVYRLPNRKNMLQTMRQLGAFMYPSSLGLYSFLVLLMSNECFYNSVKSYKQLDALWCSLFLELDRKEIECALISHDNVNISKLLRSKYLRCDAVKHGWELIKLINERP